jgi:uncharacterized membrane protein
MEKLKTDKSGFHLRGDHMTRLDAFSDVVFGFALTLLVVSLEVPKTFTEFQTTLSGFPAFAICFLFLIIVWHAHYVFFRRYGLEDTKTIFLNALLLLVVLFYVYPMKFMFTASLGFSSSAADSAHPVFTSGDQVASMMMLYGLGFAAIYAILSLLHLRAWVLRHELNLNPLECLMTSQKIITNAVVATIGLLCILFAWILKDERAGYAGYIFFLVGPVYTVMGFIYRRRRKALNVHLSKKT